MNRKYIEQKELLELFTELKYITEKEAVKNENCNMKKIMSIYSNKLTSYFEKNK